MPSVIIGTFDVTSLYTNIPHAEGIAATCAALSKKVHPCPPISDIKALMQQVLTKNNFTFMDKHYLQRHGTAMGTRMAPSYCMPVYKITSNNHNILLTSDSSNEPSLKNPSSPTDDHATYETFVSAVPPLTSNPTPIQHGTFKCDRTSRCIVCSHHIVESNSITSHSMQLTHKTKGHITCTTTNVIYLISCRVCGIQYVGETKTTLKKRFYGHRSTVNTMKTETPVGEHFNLPNHTINDMSLQGIESLGSRPDLVRSAERGSGCNAFDHSTSWLNIQEGHD
ncbi:hypothetical protein BSL78_15235 [Apostichopus japonicus]|uniref:Uncharacterized protein n=1 Tax=Stichopus japonicus TaxID=307972 RepID=A0A2G8KIV3_STIJA|nr:hypothetical protein BSL78_15235 [Apostichopus japonicus]